MDNGARSCRHFLEGDESGFVEPVREYEKEARPSPEERAGLPK